MFLSVSSKGRDLEKKFLFNFQVNARGNMGRLKVGNESMNMNVRSFSLVGLPIKALISKRGIYIIQGCI